MSENTLAARPVGASSTTFILSSTSERTNAPASEVLPVPAEPRRIMAVWGRLSVMKSQNTLIACTCSGVGLYLKL